MPANLPVRAAGRTLTVGELREALEGLSDDDFVTRDGQPIMLVASSAVGIDLDGGVKAEEGRLGNVVNGQRYKARQSQMDVA